MSALRTFLGLSVVLAMGCGGTSSAVGGDGGTGTGSSGGSTSGSSGGTSGSSGGTASGGGDDSSVSPGDDSGLPTIGEDGGVVVPPDDDAGTIAARDAGGGVTTPGRGTDGGADQIACGATSCDSATQVCCANGNARTCTSAAGCRGEILACSGSNSCPTATDVCCAEAAAGRAGTITAKCEATCPKGSQQFCTTNADCAAADICRRLSADYNVCEPAPVTPPARDAGIGIVRRDGGV
jgi:hypothetical protein